MSTSTVPQSTAPAFEPGARGTLPPAEYTTKVMPHWGPTYPAARCDYRNMDYVSIAFATDADKAAALIPAELELIKTPMPGQAAASLVFAKYRECDLGPYMEVIVSIAVLHEGLPYAYVPAIYVDNDAALLAGRELGGYPKKMAQITMRNYGDLFLSHMAKRRNTEEDRGSQLRRPCLLLCQQSRQARLGAASGGRDG